MPKSSSAFVGAVRRPRSGCVTKPNTATIQTIVPETIVQTKGRGGAGTKQREGKQLELG
jgi:hypothetical protein